MRTDNSPLKAGGEIFRVLIFALLAATMIRSLAFEPFNIPSSSMVPNLLIGDYLFVSKSSYGYSRYSFPFSLPVFSGRIWESSPRRGDVAVFRQPTDPSINFIKRIIGLPGDNIRIIGPKVFINGDSLSHERLPLADTDGFAPTLRNVEQYRETLPDGRSYNIFHDPQAPHTISDTVLEYQVPDGHYFVLGDNRDHSCDSRCSKVGFVPGENLIGRAEIIFFSLAPPAQFWQLWRWPAHLRNGRFFDLIR